MAGLDASVDDAVQALVATGALESDDRRVLDANRVLAAMVKEATTPDLPEPWGTLTLRMGKSDGRVGRLAIGTVVDSLEGCSIRFDALSSHERGFSVDLAVSPGWALMSRRGSLKASLVEWWAEDDRENVYLLLSTTSGGSPQMVTGTISSRAPIDPESHELRLLPTCAHERAVVTVPLAPLGDVRF
jgi:hypothetical protein